jgi:HAE1 family hydrophobic/amphiphilic exporter-1
MFYAIIQTPPLFIRKNDDISVKLQKNREGVEGVKSVSSLAGYEILTEGTGSNAGTCLINLRIGTIESNLLLRLAELEENLKYTRCKY